MAVEFERLVVYMDARLADYEKALAKARGNTNKQLSDMERRFQQASDKVSSFGRSLLAPLAGVASGAALIGLAKQALTLADNLSDTSKQLGITTTDLQALQYGARESGIEVEGLDTALDQLSKTVGEAATGDKTKLAQFAALGVDLKDAAGNARPLIDVLQDVSRAIVGVSDRQQQAAALNDFFGRSGTRLLPLLQQVAGGMDDLTKAAEEAGQVMSEETVQALGEAHDALEAFGVQVTIIVGGILNEFSKVPGAVREITQELANAKTVWDDFREAVASQVPFTPPMSEAEANKFFNDFVTGLGGGGNGGLTSPGLSGPGILGGPGGGLNTGLGGVGNPYAIPGSNTYNPPRTTGGSSSGANKAKQRDEALRQLAEEIQKNAELIATFGQGDAALAKITARYQALNEARRAGLEVGTEEFNDFVRQKETASIQEAQLDLLQRGADLTKSVRTEEEERAANLAELNQLLAAGAITQETYQRGLEETNTVLAEQRDLAGEVGATLFGGMLAAAQQGEGLRGVLDSISVSLGNIANQLASKALNKLFDIALDSLFSIGGAAAGSGSGGGFGGNNLGGSLTFGGPRAGGGNVYPGSAYLVGEKRPEMFVPNVPGKIVPNAGTGGGSNGGPLVQIINNVPDTTSRTERRQENGRESLRVYIDQVQAKNMTQSGSASRRTLETFGVKPRLASR